MREASCSDGKDLGLEPDPPCPLNSLRQLVITSGQIAHHLLPWLSTSRDLTRLSDVAFNLEEWDFEASAHFLTALGPSLHKLRLQHVCNNDQDQSLFVSVIMHSYSTVHLSEMIQDHLDLSSNTSLESIAFNGVDLPSGDTFGPVFVKWIPSTLDRIKSRRLEHVEFNLRLNNIGDLENLDWDIVWDSLQGPQFPCLVRILIQFDCVGGEGFVAEDVEDWFAEKLPGLVAQGILKIRQYDGRS